MRPAKKKERDIAKSMAGLAEMLAKAGLATGGVTADNAKEAARDAIISRPPPIDDAEAVLKFLRSPAAFAFKKCKECHQEFGTDYRAVAYCSDKCRARSLARIGVQWDPHKPAPLRWGSEQCPVEPPQIVPPAALKVLVDLAVRQGQILVERGAEMVQAAEAFSAASTAVESEPRVLATVPNNFPEVSEVSAPEKTSPLVSQSLTFQVGNLLGGLSFGS